MVSKYHLDRNGEPEGSSKLNLLN